MTSRILLIGGIGAGKTSLRSSLSKNATQVQKTQVLTYSGTFIDCPGEYLEIPRYYHVLINASERVAEIWALQDASKARSIYPPGFAGVFNKPVIGIVTKTDLPNAKADRAITLLKNAGLKAPFYLTSSVTGMGCSNLLIRLNRISQVEAMI